MTPHIAVIGGGISGLSAANALVRDGGDLADVTVFEGSARVGGILHTTEVAGLPVDAGADAFLARVPDAERLVRELGLGDSLVAPATSTAHVWVGGRMRPLPAGTALGVPRSLRSVARSRVLSAGGLARAGLDLVLPGSAYDGDVAVGALVRRRMGAQVVDRLVDPLLGGVYAGHADALSVEATAPQVATAARAGRSLMRGLRGAAADSSPSDGPVFRSLSGGLGRLPQEIAARLGDGVRTANRVALVERVGTAWRLTLMGGRALVVDAVVVATPAPVTAKLLRYAAPALSGELAEVETASVAIVTFAFPAAALTRAPVGSGFLVPAGQGRLMKACTLSSAKWAHLGGHDVAIVRCSVGRAGEPPPEDDDEVVARLRSELADAIGAGVAPTETRVTRWVDALPQYAVGHVDRVARIESALDQLPGLALAGSAYRGVGVPACIRSGEQAAARILDGLRARRA
ncbi:MAG TPA: protoporphyrinogen oxidase [Mycobacteriales bacterium]|nr:protoporphyrinogen oxidase [Mycobacteriales bacterium]